MKHILISREHMIPIKKTQIHAHTFLQKANSNNLPFAPTSDLIAGWSSPPDGWPCTHHLHDLLAMLPMCPHINGTIEVHLHQDVLDNDI